MSELKIDKVSPRTGNYVSLNTVGMKNIIINGDMSIAQRGTSQASISTGYNTCDRWRTQQQIGAFTQSQSTDVPTGQGFATSLKMDCTTADASPASNGQLAIQQRLEGQMLQYIKKGTSNAESLTMSFWVKSNKTGTYTAEIFDEDNTRQITRTYTIDSSNTWEKKTLTFAGDTTGTLDNDNERSFEVLWWLGTGSDKTSGTYTDGVWQANVTANRLPSSQVNLADNTANEWYITGVQLEAGTTASDFEFLPVDVNLQRCLRYYQFIGGTDEGSFAVGISSSITQACVQINFKTTMRTSPSVAISGTLLITDNTSYSLAVSALSSSSFNNNSGRIFVDHTGNSTQYRPAFLNPSSTTPADNGVTLSAEL
jgi:hypothetical protein